MPGILIAPRITEKGTMLSKNFNQFIFEVSGGANVQVVKKAIEGKYGVKVLRVNIINQTGRKIRLGRREGWRKGFKKAIVTVVECQTIEFT